MLNTPSSRRGMIVAPHHLAAQTGLSVLREGGSAVEAIVAAAATIAVVYPHMNAIGGETIAFGPGLSAHSWTQLRGALPKWDGQSVYLTGFTPFRATITIR